MDLNHKETDSNWLLGQVLFNNLIFKLLYSSLDIHSGVALNCPFQICECVKLFIYLLSYKGWIYVFIPLWTIRSLDIFLKDLIYSSRERKKEGPGPMVKQ